MPTWARIGLGVAAVGLAAYGAVAMLGGDEEPTELATPINTETTTQAPGECAITGSWTLDGPAFATAVSAWMGTDTEHLGGTYTMDFDGDGGFVSQRSAWTLRHDFPDGVIVTETTSREEGTWETDGTTITLTAPGDSAAAVMVWVEVDGELMPLPSEGSPMTAPGLSGPLRKPPRSQVQHRGVCLVAQNAGYGRRLCPTVRDDLSVPVTVCVVWL